MKIKICFITILNFVVYIISNIGKYYTVYNKILYSFIVFRWKANKNQKETITQYNKTDRVYKSPKSIRNKVN